MMKLLLMLLVAVAALQPSPAAAQVTTCGFQLGFKAIAIQIGLDVGACLEDEHFNLANGNAEQRTSARGAGGLLVWRKADNWTAYTDGYWTWVNGPKGLQKRLNTETFDFEAPPAATAPAPAAAAPAAAAQSLTIDQVAGAVRSSGFPVRGVTVYTAETDPNKLLGRPGQYVAKVSWTDDRSKNDDQTVELFTDVASLEARTRYIGAIAASGPLFAQYIYPHADRLALLRVAKELTPDQARAYEAWFGQVGRPAVAPPPAAPAPVAVAPAPAAAPAAPPLAVASGRAAPAGTACPAGYPIKGNNSSSGELIYHSPGGQFYDRTQPEACFAAAADAQAAGFRPSQR